MNFKLYGADDAVITTISQDTVGNTKICLNDTSDAEKYGNGYGDGISALYLNNLTGNAEGTYSKTYTWTAGQTPDCITAQFYESPNLKKLEIVSIVLTAKSSFDTPEEPEDKTLLGEDGKVPLTEDNASTLITTGRTLAVTNGVASLTGINSYNDGIAITFKLPDGVKLQDYESVKLSMATSEEIAYKKVQVAVNKWNASEPNKDQSTGEIYDLSSQTKIGESQNYTLNTNATKCEVPLDFTSCDRGDITGTVCLMIGIYGNNSANFTLSDISLLKAPTESAITLTEENTSSLLTNSTCTVTAGKAALTCSSTGDAIVINLPIEAGKKLQDYKGISFTFTSELASDAMGKNVIVAVNKWNTASPNVNSQTGEVYDISGQTAIATSSATIKTGDNAYKLDFDFSSCDRGDITGTIALMIGMSYNNDHAMNWSVSNVKLLS